MRALKLLLASAIVATFACQGAALAESPDIATSANTARGEATTSANTTLASAEAAPTGLHADAVAPSGAQADLTIATADEFAAFAAAVNAGTTYAGKTVALSADIELSPDTPSVGTTSMKSYVYTVDKAFQGTFDGRGHSILLKGNPLFGMVYGTQASPVRVKNLVLGGKVATSRDYTGAVASIADGYIELENVSNSASVMSDYIIDGSAGSGTGGLVGYVPATYNSYYHSTKSTCSSLKITACANKGAVSSKSEYTGGLVGRFCGDRAMLAVERCYSAGAVTSTDKYISSFVGGVVASDTLRTMTFRNCYASGKLETSVVVDENYDSQFVGVLLGYSYSSMPGKGNISHVYFGGDLKGGRTYGGLTEAYFAEMAGTRVRELDLTNGSPTLKELNATDASDPDDGKGAPYTRENGYTYAEGAADDALPQLFWEAAASAAPVAKPQATLPTAVEGLTYTGTPQAGVAPRATEGCGYTMEGWQSTDAGTHTATVTLADGYEWSDGASAAQRTVVYSIGKATLTARYRGETIEADGTPALEVAVVGFKNGEAAATAKDYVAPTLDAPAVEPGTSRELTPQGGSAANYDFTYVSGTLTVNAAPKPQLTAANTTISVDARGSAVQVYVIRDGSILTANTHYTLSFTDATGAAVPAPTKKGSYVAVVTGAGDYEGTVRQAFALTSDLVADMPSSSGGSSTASTGASNGSGASQASSGSSPSSASGTASSAATSTATSAKSGSSAKAAAVKVGTAFTVKNATGTYQFKVTSVKAGAKTATLAKAAVKAGKTASINTAKYRGTTYKVTAIGAKAFKSSKAKTVTLGANVKKIGASAFAGATATTITVKSKALTKASVKNSLKGSKVTKVKAPKGYAKKYAKLFTKANAGKKVTVV